MDQLGPARANQLVSVGRRFRTASHFSLRLFDASERLHHQTLHRLRRTSSGSVFLDPAGWHPGPGRPTEPKRFGTTKSVERERTSGIDQMGFPISIGDERGRDVTHTGGPACSQMGAGNSRASQVLCWCFTPKLRSLTDHLVRSRCWARCGQGDKSTTRSTKYLGHQELWDVSARDKLLLTH